MNSTPKTTLFMLMSADGKISTGIDDKRDFDKDLPTVLGIADGLGQYYALEQQTDLFSLNTGKVMAKVGWNERKDSIEQIPVTFIVVDSKPHLTELGIKNLLNRSKKLIIATTNKEHPALDLDAAKLEVIEYHGHIDFSNLFEVLKSKGADNLTVQSGGELNAVLVREGLIDYISIVVLPLLVGGKETPTLVDGKSLTADDDLRLLQPMKLLAADVLKNSYLHLRYEIVHPSSNS